MNLSAIPDPEVESLTSPAPWFRMGPLMVIDISMTVFYVIVGTFFPHVRESVDIALSPMMSGLDLVGLGVRRPSLLGSLDLIYYKNLIGIGVFFSVVLNVYSIGYVLINKKSAGISCREAHRRLVVTKGRGRLRTWVTLHLRMYLGIGSLAAFASFSLLNGIFGWWVFHVAKSDVFFTLAFCLGFLLPSCISVALWSIVIQYMVFDVKKILKFSMKLL